MNNKDVIKKVVTWVSLVVAGMVLLSLANLLAPEKIEITIPPTPIKLTIGCFIQGDPIFMGDIIGPVRVSGVGEIEFHSLEWNTKVTLINASCMAIESRLKQPVVRKSTDPAPHSEGIIL